MNLKDKNSPKLHFTNEWDINDFFMVLDIKSLAAHLTSRVFQQMLLLSQKRISGNFFLLKKNFFLTCIHLWETESEQGRGRERHTHTHTESKAGSRIWAVSTEPNTGLEPTNCKTMTWAEVGHLTDWATQAPLGNFFSIWNLRNIGNIPTTGRNTPEEIWFWLIVTNRKKCAVFTLGVTSRKTLMHTP